MGLFCAISFTSMGVVCAIDCTIVMPISIITPNAIQWSHFATHRNTGARHGRAYLADTKRPSGASANQCINRLEAC